MKYLNIKKALAAWQNLQPLSEKDRDRLSRRFTVDFNYNSNHIEGNTLTYGQTEILLLFGKVIGEADVRDVQEMTASNVGLRMMSEEASVKEVPLTQNFIRTLIPGQARNRDLKWQKKTYISLPSPGTRSWTGFAAWPH